MSVMRRPKRQSLLLIGLILLLAISELACRQPALQQYWNEYWAYGIKVPEDWVLLEETMAPGVPFSHTTLCPSESTMNVSFALVEIDVCSVNMTEPFAAEEAESIITGLTSKYPSLFVLDSQKMQGKWDWHIAFEHE
jgi:hypothetical protein